jgi:uncharacterized protein
VEIVVRAARLLGLVVLLALSAARSGDAAIFPCDSPRTALVTLTCDDPELSQISSEVFGLFRSWASNVKGQERNDRNASHQRWLIDTRAKCGLDKLKEDASLTDALVAKPCLLKAFEERRAFYESVYSR